MTSEPIATSQRGDAPDLAQLVRGDLARVRETYGTYLYVLHPGFLAVLAYRIAHAMRERGPFGRMVAQALSLMNIVITGADLHAGAEFGPGLFIPHSQGVIAAEYVRAGANLTLYAGVVLGQDANCGAPQIGDGVTVWTKATAFGDLSIGDNAQIGAHCLVMHDVPANHNAVGIPAEVRPQRLTPA